MDRYVGSESPLHHCQDDATDPPLASTIDSDDVTVPDADLPEAIALHPSPECRGRMPRDPRDGIDVVCAAQTGVFDAICSSSMRG